MLLFSRYAQNTCKRFLLCLCISAIFCSNVTASPKAKLAPKPVEASIIVDANTGKVLHSYNARLRAHPASLTKLMTLYHIFEHLKSKKWSMNTKIPITEKAAKMPPCNLKLNAGEYITVHDAILGLIVKSANDVSVAIAEKIAGSEVRFARMMNAKARKLGMAHTYFKNSSGLHNAYQKTTASDIVRLAMALKRDFPEYYPLFSKTNFMFKGQMIAGHNRVTKDYPGAEGLKTGYTAKSGYNLATIASRKNKALVGVVIGGSTANARDIKMMNLLDQHFAINSNHRNNVKKSKT
ncbi:MAG: D-alanyl-D-alanine carboxypeptidase family protein [Rickettsiaceae bacterium]